MYIATAVSFKTFYRKGSVRRGRQNL